ncbi:hypothetical protein EJ04DRAFT_67861 [Polyplosphaeria fusca]|uniref:Uncharacterized protein n=1 Tax=Polyplosphaeria fusca TaxID=682080 RepID=A0A9P4V625_9PLEO|nr:hypothetical protein EJ04DRAFT_67861 [Polyplosphaeria fusca]
MFDIRALLDMTAERTFFSTLSFSFLLFISHAGASNSIFHAMKSPSAQKQPRQLYFRTSKQVSALETAATTTVHPSEEISSAGFAKSNPTPSDSKSHNDATENIADAHRPITNSRVLDLNRKYVDDFHDDLLPSAPQIPPIPPPVGKLTTPMLTSIFNDLFRSPCPDTVILNEVVDSMWDGHTLLSIQFFMKALKIRTSLDGEDGSIMFFNDAPLSHAFRITGTSRLLDTQQFQGLPGQDHEWRVVWTHFGDERKRWVVFEREGIAQLVTYVLHVLRELESGRISKAPEAQPRTNGDLLSMLESGDLDPCPGFLEAARALTRSCPLDAVMELTTPFGLRPHAKNRSAVHFGDQILQAVRITRFDSYMPAFFPAPVSSSAIVLEECCTLDSEPSIAAKLRYTERYRVKVDLNGKMSPGQVQRFPKGQVYELEKEGEMEALVWTLLHLREKYEARTRLVQQRERVSTTREDSATGVASPNGEVRRQDESKPKTAGTSLSPLRSVISRWNLDKESMCVLDAVVQPRRNRLELFPRSAFEAVFDMDESSSSSSSSDNETSDTPN